MKTLYLVLLLAQINNEIAYHAMVCLADDPIQLVQDSLSVAMNIFPAEEGFRGHEVNYSEVDAEFIQQIIQNYSLTS